MKRLSLVVALSLLVGSWFSASAEEPTNLLVNGSFEEGPETGPFIPLDADSKEIKGWIISRGQIDYIGTYWNAADGKRSIDLHGSAGVGGVKQTFKTKKGTKYQVTLHLSVNPDSTKKDKKVTVAAAGEKKDFEIDGKDKKLDDMAWEKKTWEFTATDDETILEIFSAETEDTSCGPALDHVTVTRAN